MPAHECIHIHTQDGVETNSFSIRRTEQLHSAFGFCWLSFLLNCSTARSGTENPQPNESGGSIRLLYTLFSVGTTEAKTDKRMRTRYKWWVSFQGRRLTEAEDPFMAIPDTLVLLGQVQLDLVFRRPYLVVAFVLPVNGRKAKAQLHLQNLQPIRRKLGDTKRKTGQHTCSTCWQGHTRNVGDWVRLAQLVVVAVFAGFLLFCLRYSQMPGCAFI